MSSVHPSPPLSPSIFDIPPIQDILASYCTRSDLTICIRVSRTWAATFAPYLYRDIDITSIRTFRRFETQEALAALTRNQDHVRTFKTCYLTALTDLSRTLFQHNTGFKNLVRFHWRERLNRAGRQVVFKDEDPAIAIAFLENHPGLSEVQLGFKYLSRDHGYRLVDYLHHRNVPVNNNDSDSKPQSGLSFCRAGGRLKRMRIDYNFLLVRRMPFDLTLAAAGQGLGLEIGLQDNTGQTWSESTTPTTAAYSLQSFALDHWRLVQLREDLSIGDDFTLESNMTQENEESLAEEFEFLALGLEQNGRAYQGPVPTTCVWTDLSMDGEPHKPDRSALLHDVLRWSPELKRFSCPSIQRIADFELLPSTIREHCPKLRHLELGCTPEQAEDSDVAAILNSILRGLISFRILAEQFPLSWDSIQSLHRVHATTLTDLDLIDLGRWRSYLFLDLIDRLPNLRSLKAVIDLRLFLDEKDAPAGEEYDNLMRINYSHRLQRDWPFRDRLKHLHLAVFRGTDVELEESEFNWGDGSLTDRFAKYMSEQVGALYRLETFEVGGWLLMLRLNLWMRKMDGMKGLKVLDLSHHTLLRWGPDEVDWICEHWPALIEIRGIRTRHLASVVARFQQKRPRLFCPA
ncbi:hypothetical protein BGZ83_008331 [Gryganskiella cystojenkinii]|nr:hypothetical protein BGZ83_008331 [Gryganskiella cystojenkinii]